MQGCGGHDIQAALRVQFGSWILVPGWVHLALYFVSHAGPFLGYFEPTRGRGFASALALHAAASARYSAILASCIALLRLALINDAGLDWLPQ